MRYVVIESTPGYMPDDCDPFTTDDYAAAVAHLNELAAGYADDPDGNFEVTYGLASSANLAAVAVADLDKTHDLGRWIAIEIDEDDADGHGRPAGEEDPGDPIRARLEELRAELRAERISYGELAELQDLAEHIAPGDVELLEAAGVPEHAEEVTLEILEGPERTRDAEGWEHDAYVVRLEFEGRGMIVPWKQGTGILDEPAAAGVLENLLSDSSGLEQSGADFESWAGDYGFDTDSRRAEATFRAVVEQAENLRRLLGDAYAAAVAGDFEEVARRLAGDVEETPGA